MFWVLLKYSKLWQIALSYVFKNYSKGRCKKHPDGGGATISLGGGQPTLEKSGGGTTQFVQEWGGHEILTWNGGGGGRKISSEFGEGDKKYT